VAGTKRLIGKLLGSSNAHLGVHELRSLFITEIKTQFTDS
jgi:hypothetical protein